jgi:hypothetical protein
MEFKLWYIYAFNALTFVGWTIFQLAKGPTPWALVMDICLAILWTTLLVREKKRQDQIDAKTKERALR